jgi:hypothetical protein
MFKHTSYDNMICGLVFVFVLHGVKQGTGAWKIHSVLPVGESGKTENHCSIEYLADGKKLYESKG